MYNTMHKQSSTCMCVGFHQGKESTISVLMCVTRIYIPVMPAQSKQSYSIAANANAHVSQRKPQQQIPTTDIPPPSSHLRGPTIAGHVTARGYK